MAILVAIACLHSVAFAQTETGAVEAAQGCRSKFTNYRQQVAWTNGRLFVLNAREACAYRLGWPFDLKDVHVEITYQGRVEARFEGRSAMLSLEKREVVFDETASVELLKRKYALAGVAVDWRMSEMRSINGFYARWTVDGPMRYRPIASAR